MRFPQVQSILAAVLLLYSRESNSIEIEVCGKLPTARAYSAAVYNEKDSIYIIGGGSTDYEPYLFSKEVLKFDISTSSLENIGNLQSPVMGSAVTIDQNGLVWYFGGRVPSSSMNPSVETITVEPFSWDRIGFYDETEFETSAYVTIGNAIYLFGGGSFRGGITNQIIRFELVDSIGHDEVTIIGELPFNITKASAVFDGVHVYIFGGRLSSTVFSNRILQFNPTTNVTTILEETLPFGYHSAVSVFTGTRILSLGGFGYPDSGYGTTVIVEYDRYSGKVIWSQIDPQRQLPYGASGVYAAKYKRIYIFGGMLQHLSDKVLCIDVDNIDLGTTTTSATMPPTTTDSGTMKVFPNALVLLFMAMLMYRHSEKIIEP